MNVSKFVVVGVFFLLVSVLPLAAQDAAAEESGPVKTSGYYVVQVPIEKIWTHNKGYIVQYRKTPLIDRKAYLPLSWFLRPEDNSVPRKGEIILMGPGKTWPHIVVYYKDGAFDHVRLYVRRELGHISWGRIEPYSSFDEYFSNVDDLKLEFK
jgi:hypothetical protein